MHLPFLLPTLQPAALQQAATAITGVDKQHFTPTSLFYLQQQTLTCVLIWIK
jgi:hypothetical protein